MINELSGRAIARKSDFIISAHRMLLLSIVSALSIFLCAVRATAVSAPSAPPRTVSPIVTGDEPIIVTDHTIRTNHGSLQYEAFAGRLPIRVDQTGEVHGRIFFVAYVARNRGADRPLTIVWNGGPTVPSTLLHMEALGPRVVTKGGMADNRDTPLDKTDLVFYDAIETGFSRPTKPEFAQEFLSDQGDFAATAEFIRAYRSRFAAETRPLFLLGESYGGWRVAAVADILAKRGVDIAGLIIVSGGFAGVNPPFNFQDAMQVPQRTAIAFYYERLPPELMRNRDATLKEATDWATNIYWPALDHVASLSDAQKATVVDQLAIYTGVRANQIDNKTMILHNKDFVSGFFDKDPSRVLNWLDARKRGIHGSTYPTRSLYISNYLRGELAYRTDLTYADSMSRGIKDVIEPSPGYSALEQGYMPVSGPAYKSSGEQWLEDSTPKGREAQANIEATSEMKYLDMLNGHWLEDSLDALPRMRIFVPMGRFDISNMCAGQALMGRFLKPEQATRVTAKCYEGGHVIYEDEPARIEFDHDIASFIAETVGER
jgi:carboxypeptidase C (cathepsin A)